MTGTILRFPDPHQAAVELLPWFVNGTLEGEELALVERHLGECSRCRQEVDALRQFAAAYVGSEEAPDPAPSLHELRRQLGGHGRGWRMRLLFSRLRRFWARTQPWAQWVVVAELAVIVVLGALLLSAREPTAPYRTLSADEVGRQAAGKLVVAFDPHITEIELRRIVRASGARIVDGPTMGDAYVLEVAAGRQATALDVLRGQRGVVLAERLDSAAAP